MNVEEPTTDFDEETTSELIEEDTIVGNTDGIDVIIVAIELLTSDSEVVVGVVTIVVPLEAETGLPVSLSDVIVEFGLLNVGLTLLIVADPFLVSDDDKTTEELALGVELEELVTDAVLLTTSSVDELIRVDDDDLINEVFSDSVTVGMILGMKLLTNSEELETDFVAVTGSKPDVINSELSLEDMMEVEALVLILPDPFFVSNEDRTVIELALEVELEELTTDVVLLITWSLDEPIREDDDSISEVILDSVMVGIILGMKLLTDSEELIAIDVTNVEVTLTGLEVDTTVKLIFDVSCVLLVSTVDVKRIEEVSLKVTDE